ncbi:MAG: hypothetical protein AB7N76_11995 [Planctomycetota bacterium]
MGSTGSAARRRRLGWGQRLTLVALWGCAVLSGGWLVGCQQDSIRGSGTGSASTVSGVLGTQDLGAVVFDLYRSSITSETPGAARDARLATLDGRRAEFVQAIDDIVNLNTVQNAGQTADALYALIDKGTLPALTDHVAATLDDLAQDPQALDAVLQLVRGHASPLPVEDVVALLGRMFNYPETERLWRAVAQLVDENDGVDASGQPNGEPRLVQDLLAFARNLATKASQSGAPTSKVQAAVDELFGALTEDAVVHGTFDFGPPEWVVRVDSRGLPRPARDASGALVPPFADQNGDGLADVDARDRFVDAAGKAFDRPAFGQPGASGYDPSGRALGGGALLYDYVDAKRTNLALFMQLGGELLRRDAHARGRQLLEGALGAPLPSGGYSPDGPAVDLVWALLSLLEPEVAGQMLRATSDVIRRDPDLAERLLVAAARGLTASRQAAKQSSFVGLNDPRVQGLIDDLLPLCDDLFEQPASGAVSTARQLIDVLAQLRTSSPDLGYQLAPLLRFVRVEREATPDADRNSIDEARSAGVDRAQPAWVGATDNRSALHQLLDLLARAHGCSILGNDLAVLILDLMADQSAQTVGSLVSLLNALPGFLPNLVCPGVSQDLSSLDALAKSGALDALLPLAKAFKDRGQTLLLVNLLSRVQRDYETVLRPVEADLIPFLESGAVEALLELCDLSRQVTDPRSGKSAADITARALELLVDDDGVVLDPRGAQVPSRARLLVRALTGVADRVQAAGLGGQTGALTDALVEVFLERVVVNGQERLRNGSLIPLVARAAEAFARALPDDAAARAQEVQRAQQALRDAVAQPDAATLLSLLRTIDQAPSRALIQQGLVDLLTPQRNTAEDIFGGVAKVSVLLLQKPVQAGALQGLLPFAARVLDPQSPLVPVAVRAFNELLTADQGRTVLNLLRAATNPAASTGEPPATTLLRIVREVSDAGASQGGAPYDRAALERDLRRAVAFLRDKDAGLPYLYELVRTRQVR